MLASIALAGILAATPLEQPPIARLPYYGASVSRPQTLGVFGGMMFTFPGRPLIVEHHGPSGYGMLVEAEAALAGGKVAAGLFTTGGMAEASARLVALRTWGNPWAARSQRTYVGPEITLQFALLRVNVGYLRSNIDDVVSIGIGVSLLKQGGP
jgi:hypothetical protein